MTPQQLHDLRSAVATAQMAILTATNAGEIDVDMIERNLAKALKVLDEVGEGT